MAEPEAYRAAAGELLTLIGDGALNVITHRQFALRDAATAHSALEARQTTGASLLIP